jgi:hypothetical protein
LLRDLLFKALRIDDPEVNGVAAEISVASVPRLAGAWLSWP